MSHTQIMARIGSTPIGEAFLPSLSVARLEKLYSREKDSRAKLRLLAAMLRKKERTIRVGPGIDVRIADVRLLFLGTPNHGHHKC